jgi:hypothetical protein
MDNGHITKMGLRIADPFEISALGRKAAKAMVIPYFDLDGNQIEFCRYRYLEDPRNIWERVVTNTKSPRYFQPAGTGLHAYLPPFIDWNEMALSANKPLLITEGEKKAACATAHGFPCVGLGGVDSFASKKEEGLLVEELRSFKWEGRDVIIVYDSDAARNRNVLQASVRLGRRLYALGAVVRIATLPAAKDGAKQGIDDFILAAKNDNVSVSLAVSALLKQANAELFEKEIALYDFNRQFVYLRDMDRVICRDDATLLNPDAFIRRAYAAAKHREFSIKTTKEGGVERIAKMVSTAEAWMEWPERLMCHGLDFDPKLGEFTKEGYNIWRGWPVLPVEGDVSLWVELLDHLFQDAPACDRKWFEQWMAYPVQHPGAKLKTACLLWSKAEGTGKSTILEGLRSVYGALYAPMNDSAVDLQWTDWLVNKLLVGVDDISAKTRDDHAAKWKNLITAPRLTIQKRNTHSFEIMSCVNFIMTSNDANALRLPPQDRRNFVHRVADWGTVETRPAFFNKLYPWLRSDAGAAALLHYLLNMNLTGFDPDAPAPVTESKIDMVEMSKGPLESWVDNLKDAPDAVLCVGASVIKGDMWTSDDLADLYNGRAGGTTKVTRVTMGMALANAGIGKAHGGKQIAMSNGLRLRLFIVRNPDKWAGHATPQAIKEHYEETRGAK